MIIYKNNKAFTLIELMVWITILWVLAFAITNIDFNRLSNSQKLDIFSWNIKNSYETIRNNALSWKWIWVNLIVPYKWTINFSKNNNWTISWEAYDESNAILDNSIINIPSDFSISSIKCWEYLENRTLYNEMTNTWTIEFNWINIGLNINWDINCDANKDKVLELIIQNKQETKIININTLNWLFEIKK
jgi:hypothetical protein